MKRYIGANCVYVCLFIPVILAMLAVVTVLVLSAERIIESFFVIICSFFFCASLICVLIREPLKFYAWGTFGPNSVKVNGLFLSGFVLEYSRCADLGIGYYHHGFSNSAVGIPYCYIYLSYDRVDRRYLRNINRMPLSDQCIKVRFDEQLYQYLLDSLPRRQALILRESYHAVFSAKKD